MKSIFHKIITKLVSLIDPKLDKYRPKQPPYTPKDLKQLISVLKRTPKSILSDEQREIIAAAMSFDDRMVNEIMMPEHQITYVSEKEVLGPLTLDKLYKSGFSHFPVTNTKKEIIGILHTDALNSLEIKDTDIAKNFLDPKVYYVRNDYTLKQALAAFLRTNCYFFLVVNHDGHIVGLLTYEMLAKFLLGGKEPTDDFDRDDDKYSVSHR